MGHFLSFLIKYRTLLLVIVIGFLSLIGFWGIWIRDHGTKRGVTRRWTPRIFFGLLVLTWIIGILTTLPIEPDIRSDLFQLLGLALTAAIALASSTFIGNTMAGFMLKSIGAFRPGDYIYFSNEFGRVTEQGLLHTEIQTEHRDLMTVPNLQLVTNSVKVVRSSGTVISGTVSLGYDVPIVSVEKALCGRRQSTTALAVGE